MAIKSDKRTRLFQRNRKLGLQYATTTKPCKLANEQTYSFWSPTSLPTESFSRTWSTQSSESDDGTYAVTLPYTVKGFKRTPVAALARRTLECGAYNQYTDTALSLVSPPIIKPSQDVIDALVNDAKFKLAAKVKDRKSLLILTALEAGKTIEMLRGRLLQIVSSYRHLRKGNLRKALRQLRSPTQNPYAEPKRLSNADTAQNNWLEYRYGMMPFLMDTQGIAEQFADTFILGERRDSHVIKAGARWFSEPVQINEQIVAAGYVSGYRWPSINGVGTRQSSLSYKIWATIRVSNPTAKGAVSFGLPDIGLVLYESVPLSFVADWFLNLGEWLDSLTAYLGVEVLDAGEGYAWDTHKDWAAQTSTPGWILHPSGRGADTALEYTRARLTSYELKPTWRGLTGTTYWKHYVDTVALARSILGKKK